MKRILASTILTVATTTLTFGGGITAAEAEANTGCAEPVPVRSYTQGELSYRLAVDLTDCDWWDRKHIQLDAELQRISAAGDGGGAGSLAFCGVVALSPETEDMSDEGTPGIEGTADTGAGSSETAAEPAD